MKFWGIIFLIIFHKSIIEHWQVILGIIVSASIAIMICSKMKEGKSDKEKIQVENNVFDGYILLLCVFFIGSCMFGGDKDKKVEVAQNKPSTEQVEQQKQVEKPPEKTPEQIQDEINKQRILNAKNWCSKVKATLDSEESKWHVYMRNDDAESMRTAYNFMDDYIDSFPEVPSDLPTEIKSDMREAVRLAQLVFKSRMAIIDSLNYMSRDRENWYSYNEEIAEQTKAVYQDTKQEVEQIYYLLDEIRNKLE